MFAYKTTLMLMMLLCACFVSASEDEIEALALYHKAIDAFEQDNLAKATQFTHQALALKSTSGNIKTNLRYEYYVTGVGRNKKRHTKTYGDNNVYNPNELLSKIKAEKQHQVSLATNTYKRKNPPKLIIHSINIIEEDKDGVVSALEHATLSFVIENIGNSKADNIDVSVFADDFTIAALTLSSSIGSLDKGEKQIVKRKFTLPKDVPDNLNLLTIEAFEGDNLGNTLAHVPFTTRPYFAPLLEVKKLSNRSEVITSDRPATLYFEVKNVGAEVARNVNLELDLDYANRITLLDELDVTNIRKLKIGEKRVVSLTLEVRPEVELGDLLGLSLQANYRGQPNIKLPLHLALNSDELQSVTGLNEQLAGLNRFKSIMPWAKPTKSYVVLIDNAQGEKPKQSNNLKNLSKVFKQGMSVPHLSVEKFKWTSTAQWNNYFSTGLKNALTEAKDVDTLHLYLNGFGEYDPITQQAYLYKNSRNKAQKERLSTWLNSLSNLNVNQIKVYLEVPFNKQKSVSPLIIQQSLVVNISPKIKLYTAAQPGQNTTALAYANMGFFSYTLADALSGQADINNDGELSNPELKNHLALLVPKLSGVFTGEHQIPQ